MKIIDLARMLNKDASEISDLITHASETGYKLKYRGISFGWMEGDEIEITNMKLFLEALDSFSRNDFKREY